jgi:uncharacterized protein HemX
MGAAAAIPAVISGGAALLGINEQRKARRAGERAANEQRAHQQQQEATIRKESDRLNAEIARTQRKVNVGAARANRSRIRGGIFGESEPTQRTSTATLG